ncbi:MAG: methyltransferase domain-containing protein [Alphaproteobacteria bacterium]
MDDHSYALRVFQNHFTRSYPKPLSPEFTALELGPGDSIISGVIAKAHGAHKTYLVDSGDYVTRDTSLYRALIQKLQESGLECSTDLATITHFDALLQAYNVEYCTEGLSDLKNIPDSSVDFIWSQSVLEHVRKKDFDATMRELHRILKPGGKMSHSVDLKDHLDYALNNLRFPTWFWENEYVARAGFYTNRINYAEIKDILKGAEFVISWEHIDKWYTLPIKVEKIHRDFKPASEDILKVLRYNFVAEKAALS